jgi:hypothetical protein
MDTLSNDLRAGGRALAWTLIEVARGQSAAVGLEEVTQIAFIGEFVVMCEAAFGIVAVRSRQAELLRQAFDDEVCRFNPNHPQLLERRLESYFEALSNVGETHDVGARLSKVLAGHVGVGPEISSLASGMFEEALVVFFELAGGFKDRPANGLETGAVRRTWN